MKAPLVILCALTALVAFAGPQDAGAPPANGAPAATGPGAGQAGTYANLTRQVFELGAQYALLNEMAQDHQKRATEAPTDQAAKATWENALARELGEKATAVLTQLNEVSRQRQAFEQSHPGEVAAGTAGATVGSTADAVAYLARIDERLERARQEMAAAVELGRTYSSQLLTNKNTEDYSRISGMVQENAALVNHLEKEQFDLELRKLEFRALRRQ